MSGELQILFLVLLAVAVGAAGFLYYLWTRRSRDRNATEANYRQEVPPLPQTDLMDGPSREPHVSDEETEEGAVKTAAGDHEGAAVLDESPPKVDPGLRPGEGAEAGRPISAPHEEPRAVASMADQAPAPDEAPHEERVAGGGRQPESTLSQAESEEVAITDAAQTAKEVPPEVEEAAALASAPEVYIPQSGSDAHVATGIPEPTVETCGVRNAGTAEQLETNEDHEATDACEEQAHLPVESATPVSGSEEATPSNLAAPSGPDVLATEEPDKGPPTGDEQPPKALDLDEVPGLTDRDDLAPESPPEIIAGDDLADLAVGGAEDYHASSEETDVIEDERASGDQEAQENVQPVPPVDADTASGADSPAQIAVTGAAAVSGESDLAPKNDAVAETEVPIEAKSAEEVAAAVSPTSTSGAEQVPGPMTAEEECSSVPKGEEQEVDATGVTQAAQTDRARKKKPRKYKGLARAAPQSRDTEPQASRAGSEEPAKRERSLPIEVRLRFDRDGFCSVSLIARRSAGLPEDMTVAAQAGEVDLRAMQDEWYQDVVPADISRVLRDGAVWTQEGANGECRWSLSGRALYVLADRSDISGYVSQACLDLGRDHAVLCSEPIRSRVEEAIQETGAEPTTVLNESLGAPPGWIVFRGVVPKAPVDPVGEDDIFNALRPLPRIEISLERGIRLQYANWLEGYPPLICIYGDPEHTAEVRIDGQVAACGEDGTYQAPGWDLIGSHSVWCSGISKSYSIVPFAASWERWDAYAFPVTYGSERSIAVCGPLVRCVSDAPQSQAFSVSAPESNPVLVGQAPGQHALAASVSGVRGTPRIASPLFCPVWALPRDPLRCDKKAAYILLIGEMAPPEAKRESLQGKGAGSDRDVDAWCHLILDANRKGLKTQPQTEAVRDLWLSYKRLARRIWRARK